jgi:VWFA-related protein
MGRMSPIRALVLLLVVTSPMVFANTTPQTGDDTLKVIVDLVDVPFSVVDRNGKFVPNLTARDFLVEEDGRRQEIRNFARENELPLTLGLLVDTSPSVRPVFDEEKTTAIRFLESIVRSKDLALVIGFDRSVTLVQDFTENTKLLKRAIDDLEIGGGTSLYDAIYLVSEEKLRDEAGRKAIIVISDGEDTTSKVKLTEALIASHQSDTVIYAISNSTRGGFFSGRRRGGFGGDVGTLRRFTDETGGTTFVVSNENSFKRIFDQIAQELRTQYSLAYVSTNTARDGRFRQIRIIPRDSSHTVRARKGYYAAKRDTQ